MTPNDAPTEPPAHPPTSEDSFRVVDNAVAHRFEAYLDDELAGFLDYHSQPGLLTILHTEVDRSHEGHQVGSRLVAHVLDDLRQRRMQVLSVCPFATSYIQRHPEYQDLLRFQ